MVQRQRKDDLSIVIVIPPEKKEIEKKPERFPFQYIKKTIYKIKMKLQKHKDLETYSVI